MTQLQAALENEKFTVANIDYPSREQPIEELAKTAVADGIDQCQEHSPDSIHFVTHSLGGILVRQYFQSNELDELGRVVMLGPPNQGSEVVDKLGSWWVFRKLNGPAGSELGTGKDSTPNSLGPVHFELGVIAGDRSINRINSRMITAKDDGKVSVAFTKVEGMKEHIVLHATHTFIMKNKRAIEHTIRFLKTGSFEK